MVGVADLDPRSMMMGSMLRFPLRGRRRCSPICRATPTGWPSRTDGSSPTTSAASPSATRTTASDGLARRKIMTLAADEFIRRFLLHVLPKGFHRIRHYGLLANTGRAANIARLRELLGSIPASAEASASLSQDEPAETVLPPCPCCGGRMIVIEFFERGMQPRYRQPSPPIIRIDTS